MVAVHYPSPELVAVAWVKTTPGVNSTKVATTLPGDATTWAATGFVTATVVGGDSQIDVPLHTPVMAFDCWANAANSNKAPWGQAGALASAIQAHTYRVAPFEVPVPDDFHPARLLSVYVLEAPQRIVSDAAGFARVRVVAALTWTVTDA